MFGLTNAWTRDLYFIITVVSKNRVSELTIKNWHLVLVCTVCTSVRRWDKSGGKGRQARGQPDDIWARLQGERENRGDKHLLIGRKTLERFCSFFFFWCLDLKHRTIFRFWTFSVFGINILTTICEWNLQVKRCRNSEIFLQISKNILNYRSWISASTAKKS